MNSPADLLRLLDESIRCADDVAGAKAEDSVSAEDWEDDTGGMELLLESLLEVREQFPGVFGLAPCCVGAMWVLITGLVAVE